jgi:Glycosyl hydrolase family 10
LGTGSQWHSRGPVPGGPPHRSVHSKRVRGCRGSSGTRLLLASPGGRGRLGRGSRRDRPSAPTHRESPQRTLPPSAAPGRVACHGKDSCRDCFAAFVAPQMDSRLRPVASQTPGSPSGFRAMSLGPSTMALRPRDHFVSMRPWHEAKRKGAVKLVEALKAKGAPINGVGLQHHVDMDWPTLNEIDTAISEECRCKRQVQPVSQRTPRFRSTDTGEALWRFVCHLCEALRCSDAGHVVGRHRQELVEERLAR